MGATKSSSFLWTLRAMVKRKRTQEAKSLTEKRRQVSPDDEDEGDFISDDGMRFEGEHEDGVASGDEDMKSAGESDGSASDDDEDEWNGLNGASGETEDGKHTGTKPKKPPTGEELRNIKDATDLYRSSSFKLQIDALLPNVQPKYQRYAPLDRFLLSLYTFINSLSPIDADYPLAIARSLLKKGISVPYPLPTPTEDTNWKVSFEKPEDITIVGSWTTKLAVKAQDKRPYRVDLALEMPSSIFQEKDYLNGRFFHKRAYYLSVIAAALKTKKSGLNVDLTFESAMGDSRLTTLIVRSRADGSLDDFSKLPIEIRIIPTLSASSPVQLNRLAPQRSNIRTTAASSSATEEMSTPIYNTTLLLSTVPRAHLLRVYALQKSIPAFSDALTLLKVWANQRGYGEGHKLCVRGFEGRGMWWAAVLDLLVSGEEPPAGKLNKASRRKPLGKGLSSYQLFRAALDFFSKHDFSQEHVFLKSEDGHRFPPHEYDGQEPVFVDHTSSVNLLAGVPLSSLEMLKYDAKLTLEGLNESSLAQDPFTEVFLQDKRDIQARFDVVVRVDLSSAKLSKPSAHTTLDCGSAYNALMGTLASTLRTGLGNRAKAVAILHPSSDTRQLSQAQPSNNPIIYIGLVLDTDHAFRLVDHGPAADNTDSEIARQFRELWGDKAELRRFKDGSITESVVWEVTNADERARIPFYVARYLLQRHCGVPNEAVKSWQADFDQLLKLPEDITTLYQAAGAPAGFKAAMSAFDSLVKSIKALDDELPLAVLNVSPVSESLRYTNVFSPVALPSSLSSVLPSSARYLPVMDIIVEFEKSGRWPDDLRAIQKIKLAFFETLGSALMHAVPGLRATVVLGELATTSELEDAASLEIFTPDGWAFSARIWHDREATLLDGIIDDKPHLPKHVKKKLQKANKANGTGPDARERALAVKAKEVYTRRFVHAPRHHRAIAALSHRFSAFAGTVRLVKRWLASHWLLHGHIREEAVELLVAGVFLGSTRTPHARASVPGTKERGFAVVVRFLAEWEWERGVSVPLYESEEDRKEAEEARKVEVSAGKSGVWALATEMDPEGRMWTAEGPDAIVARRVRAIAKASWTALQGMEGSQFDAKTLFVHPTDHYDFLIQLDHSILPRYHHNVSPDTAAWNKSGKYANGRVVADSSAGPLLPGFDPGQWFFDDLKRVYTDTFKIFYDPFGGDRYGAVWDPTLKQPRPFRVLGGFSSTPAPKENEKEKSKDKALVSLNSDAVLTEIERMGAGIISGITVQV